MSFSTSLIAFAVICFTIFVTYETFSTLFLFNKFKYPKMLNFILSIDTSYLIKTLQLNKKEDKYQSLDKKNKSLFFKIFSKINLGYKFSFHKNIINEFSNNLSYYDRDFNYRQQEKIERIRKFLNLLIYFNQTKNSEPKK